MQFIYDKNAGVTNLNIDTKSFHHIFNVRRKNATNAIKNGEIFNFANLNDSAIHRYKMITLGKKSAEFVLLDSTQIRQDSPKTHIIQSIISDIDKILPFLNELFVEKISLFYADFSQKNIRINMERINSILTNSSMQCGRLSKMQVEIFASIDEVLMAYNNVAVLDFGGNRADLRTLNHFVIGPEGGFSKRERKIFANFGKNGVDSLDSLGDSTVNLMADSKKLADSKINIISLNHPLILRSKTASIVIASQFVGAI